MIRESRFKPAWWLPNAHLQTMWPQLAGRDYDIPLTRQRLDLPDGDFIDVDWLNKNGNGPIIIMLHGLTGSSKSTYIQGALKQFQDLGWRAAIMHFRGCSGEVNRLPRFYTSGDTGDIAFLVNHIHQREPNTPLAAVGFSLGGSVLLKWLGMTEEHNPLKATVAVSVPFDFNQAADYIDNNNMSRFYQWYMLRNLRNTIRQKYPDGNAPVNFNEVEYAQNFLQFDTSYTAPLHGYKDATDYYTSNSSRPWLPGIAVPTLIIHAMDDPFMGVNVIPEEKELSSSTVLELSRAGGHVGFVGGNIPLCAEYWLDKRIADHLMLKIPQLQPVASLVAQANIIS